ncbi:MAG TPA: RDD family protein [Anaeromyxobacteraceae bacterium]
MRCPRCRAEIVGEGGGSCPRCGAPLRLPEEPAPHPVDRPVELDRRAGDRDPGESPHDTAPGPFGGARAAPPPPPPAGPAPDSRSPRFTPRIWLEEPAGGAGAERDLGTAGPPEGAPGDERVEFAIAGAPPLPRLASWAVDGLLAGAFAWLLVAGGVRAEGLAAPDRSVLPWLAALAALVHLAHATVGHALAGRTLGKWLLRLVLVARSGRRPGPGTCLARGVLAIASAGLLGLGLVPALLGRSGRALHDIVLGTAVARLP